MTKTLNLITNQYWPYLQKYWFQITICSILCFIVFKKDLSFQINLNTPEDTEEFRDTKTKMIKQEPKRLEMTERQVVTTRNTVARSGMLQGIGDNGKEKSVVYQSNGELDDWSINTYINRFRRVVIKEQEKYQIPASIIMANALFHSFAGQNELVIKGNNHFGLKCSADWSGSKQKIHRVCYRKYNTSWESFRDHSLYLQQERFSSLSKYDMTDYEAWAKELERIEYGKHSKMAEQLITIIERYKLYQLDLSGI